MSPEPVEPPKNQREDAEIAFDDLVKHFEPLFAHLRVRRSLSKMVFVKGWAPTVANGGCRRKKSRRKIPTPEPEQPGEAMTDEERKKYLAQHEEQLEELRIKFGQGSRSGAGEAA